jgi:hypothetical protein
MKDRCKCGQSMNLGAFRLKIRCETNNRRRLWELVKRKRPKLWPNKWICHNDNAPLYEALRVRKFLAKKSITKMDHPPYSPDLDPSDFWLSPKLKSTLKGQRFADINYNVTMLL